MYFSCPLFPVWSHDLLANVRHVKFYMYHLLSYFEWNGVILFGVWITGIVLLYAGAVMTMLSGLSGLDMCWLGLCMDGSGLASSGS